MERILKPGSKAESQDGGSLLSIMAGAQDHLGLLTAVGAQGARA